MQALEKSDLQIFREYCRHDSGKSICDSGGAYERHHEKPLISLEEPTVKIDWVWEDEVSASIETGKFLASFYEVNRSLMQAFDTFQEKNPGSWFEVANQFMEAQGFFRQARDNVYNNEQDLTQVYVWEVWTKDPHPSDWIYADESVSVIFIHTGCDVRGGYSPPIFCEPRYGSDYTVPFDVVVGWSAVEGRKDGEELSRLELSELDEEWQIGYSSRPTFKMSDRIKRVFQFTKTDDSICIQLDTGEIVKVMPYAQGE